VDLDRRDTILNAEGLKLSDGTDFELLEIDETEVAQPKNRRVSMVQDEAALHLSNLGGKGDFALPTATRGDVTDSRSSRVLFQKFAIVLIKEPSEAIAKGAPYSGGGGQNFLEVSKVTLVLRELVGCHAPFPLNQAASSGSNLEMQAVDRPQPSSEIALKR
jgi:hypothetical protein